MTTSEDPLLNKQLGDYTITGLLGQGGMARIYKGYDAKLDRYAAIKIIDSTLAASQDADEYRERFLREARAIARLRHPSIVNIYQFGEVNSTYYMAMAFLEGQDLRHILKAHVERGERIPTNDAFRIIRDIASALDYAHQQGVIHRDIKPSNIMVTSAGAVLMDFGLALHVPEGTTGNIFGTAHYIAPEQAVSSANAVPQSDLYSLGVVLYEMLVGKVPFDDPSAMSVALKHLNDPPPPPRRFNPEISPEVESVLMRALEKEPQDRFPTGASMVRALEAAIGYKDEDETLKDLPPPRPTPPPPKEVRLEIPVSQGTASRISVPAQIKANTVWIVGAVVVAVLLIAGLAFLNSGGQQGDTGATRTAAAIAAVTEEATGERATNTLAPTLTATPAATEGPTSPPTATVPVTPALETVRQITARGGPGSQYPAVATVESGQRLDIIGISEDGAWYQVRLADGSPGWLSASPALVNAAGADLSSIPIAAAPSNTPTNTPTITPSPLPTAAVAGNPTSAPEAEIMLVYDPDNLVLLNRSNRTIDVSRLSFVQTTASGRELTFTTDRWEGGGRPPSALPAGDCFQVWTTDFTSFAKPDYCDDRQATAQVGPAGWFWISDDADATFEVRIGSRGRDVLAVCQIDAGQCQVSLQNGPMIAATEAPTESPSNTPPFSTPDTATSPPTVQPSPVPRATQAASAPVHLVYDTRSLSLINHSSRTADVSGLIFVQITSAGRQLSFETERWEGGSAPTAALPAGDCFQVWRDSETGTLPQPADCGRRHAWQAVGSQRWFWTSDDPDATFEVRRGSEVLAVCPISAGECGFDPSRSESSLPVQIASAPSAIAVQSAGGSANTPQPAVSGSVMLIYDGDTLVLLNRSASSVDVSGLTFVQVTTAGQELSFSSDRWAGGGQPPSALPGGDCFQVWRDTISNRPVPDNCQSRQSWQMVSSSHWFWISDNPQATFEVRRGEDVVAVCRIGDGQCALNLGQLL